MRRETEMGKWFLGGAAAGCAALAAFGASAAIASTHAGGVTIKVTDKGQTYVINKSATDSMYFSPGTASVKSGQTLTVTYDGKPQDERFGAGRPARSCLFTLDGVFVWLPGT